MTAIDLLVCFAWCYSHASLHCVTVVGWVKGVDCRPGAAVTKTAPNHRWNAVHVDGSWQLIDCHWATRYMQAESSGRKHTDNLVYELARFFRICVQ